MAVGSYNEIFTEQPAAAWGLALGGFCLLIQWGLVGLFIWQLPPEIPLWYSLPAGTMQLSAREWFLLLPGLSLGIGIVNLIMIRIGAAAVKVYASLMMWLTTLIIFMATIAMLHIILLAR
jgi:hypothetical protein